SELPTVKGVKDAKGDFAAASRLIAETDLAWYSGDDPLNLPWLSVGASGFISVVGHAAPRELAELWDAFDRGDIERAREINAQTLIPLAEQQARLGGVTLAKDALRMQGIEVGDPRLPVLGADADELEGLRLTMKKAGVLKE
ncbi:dihydrodipicolinate synthase family protein, partial [Corynebacterium stationis]